MALSDIDLPEQSSLTIRLPDAPGGAIEIRRFISYCYNEHFLTPSDAGHFVLAGAELTDAEKAAIVPRARVLVAIDDLPQSAQIIQKVRSRSSRSGGSLIEVETKDWLSPAVDSHVDPQVRFTPSMTLFDLVAAVLEPFGMEVASNDNTANRNAIAGIYGSKTSKNGKPLKSYVLHQEKPYPNEGAFAFASRVAERNGLWIWPSSTEGIVILGQPDFDQSPSYQIRHKVDQTAGQNNALDADVCNDGEEQPSCILASGFGGGGEFAKSTLRGAIINPVIDADIGKIIDAYPTLKFVQVPLAAAAIVPQKDSVARPLFLYDAEAKTQDQLNAFLIRELSLRMRKSLVAKYRFVGHKLGGHPVAVDTIVDVQDDRSIPQLQLPMWVLSRDFSKSSEGTHTTVELIRPGTLVFASE